MNWHCPPCVVDVWFSYNCPTSGQKFNRSLFFERLETTEVDSFTVPEARSLKSRCQRRAMLSLKAREKEPSWYLPSFLWCWQSSASLVWEIHHSSLHYCMAFSLCQCLWPNFSFLTKIEVIGLRPILIQHNLMLTWWHLQRLSSQIRTHSQLLGHTHFGVVVGGWCNSIHNNNRPAPTCSPQFFSLWSLPQDRHRDAFFFFNVF